MALRNRQDGKVEIFVGTQKVDGLAKNVIEFDELALKTDLTAATAKQALLTTLGIPTYANETSAGTALAPGVVYYNTETARIESAIV